MTQHLDQPAPERCDHGNWSEPVIAAALVRQVFKRQVVCVVPNCQWTGHECDLLIVEPRLRIIDVEIKISRADLKADAGKDKWWRRFGTAFAGRDENGRDVYHIPTPVAKTWPQRVWKHYYAMPADIWQPELLAAMPSPASGVILLKSVKHFAHSAPVVYASVERRAKPCPDADKLTPEQVIDVARLASLRLWERLAA